MLRFGASRVGEAGFFWLSLHMWARTEKFEQSKCFYSILIVYSISDSNWLAGTPGFFDF